MIKRMQTCLGRNPAWKLSRMERMQGNLWTTKGYLLGCLIGYECAH